MKKLLIILVICLSQVNYAIADVKISFVDLDKIIMTSKPGSSILKQLDEINNQISKNLQDNEKVLKNKETKIISQKNIISTEEFQSNITNLKIEINKYNLNRQKTINDFNKLKIDSTNKFFKDVNILLINYSDKKSISLILPKKNVIVGKNEFDITDEIIKIVNNEIKEFKIK
ncbi:OmpH family outer membrane protein [Candidatus Pelagibacter sp.]|jgi:outer membrane protein|nr:OmpH family outer membrane protein [Candidatus Pelagibacter sp.]